MTNLERVQARLSESRETLDRVIAALDREIEAAAAMASETIAAGRKVLLFGNGGSAAQAQHLAAELAGRYQRERAAMAAVALTTDTSILTAVANDYGFDRVFARQVEGLGRRGDLLWGLTTSGESENVVAALRAGRELGCRSLVLSGRAGGAVAGLADLTVIVPAENTARIQEMHLLIGHIVCELVEAAAV